MKRTIAILLALLMLTGCLPVSAADKTAELQAVKPGGDVNTDYVTNAKDVTYLRRALAGGYGVTVDAAVADVNKDGVVNAKDVTYLRRALAGGYGVVLG